MQSPKEKFGLISEILASSPEVEVFCQRHGITFVRFYKTDLMHRPRSPKCYAAEEHVPYELSSFADLTNATQALFGHHEFDAFVTPTTDYRGNFRFQVALVDIARKLRKKPATDPLKREEIDKFLAELSEFDDKVAVYNDTKIRAEAMRDAIIARLIEIESTQEFIDYCVEYVAYHAKAVFSQSNAGYLKHVDAANAVSAMTRRKLVRISYVKDEDEEDEDDDDCRSC